jgi:hypothetical protein
LTSSLQRNELDSMYESDMNEMFDITEARKALQAKRAELLAECDANAKLQRRFDQINMQLRASGGGGVPTSSTNSRGGNNGDDDYPDDFGPSGGGGGSGGGYGFDAFNFRGQGDASYGQYDDSGPSGAVNYDDVELDFDEAIFEPSAFSSYASSAAAGERSSSSPSSSSQDFSYGERPALSQTRDSNGDGSGIPSSSSSSSSLPNDRKEPSNGRRGGLFRNVVRRGKGNKEKETLADV